MNSVTAVLVALVLIVVVLLVLWLVLRSRGTTPSGRGSGPSGGADPTPPSVVDRLAPERAPEGTPEARSESGAARDRDLQASPGGQQTAPAAAEEYVALGLTDADQPSARDVDANVASQVASEEAPDGGPDDGAAASDPVAGDAGDELAPRTPAEAFGGADETVDPADAEAARREGSVLDETDVDSTPLFRSIREERLGVAASQPEPVTSDEQASSAGQPPSDDAPAGDPPSDEVAADEVAPSEAAPSAAAAPQTAPGDETGSADEAMSSEELVADEPEIDLSWSHERRGWDEQAHDAPAPTGAATAEVVAPEEVTSAPGTSPGDVDEQEERPVETHEESAAARSEPAVATGEHPPIRRVSELHEVVDGGFGIGSAAVLADGAQPLGHPIKANLDTKTYQDLHSPWYDETEPDVWFLDAGFAERAGFRRAEQPH